MNIFYLDNDPRTCARMHNNKHAVKMILEYAQLLSTAHRVLDGVMTIENKYVPGSLPPRYRKTKRWILDSDELNARLYAATHINHPSAVWARQSRANYIWLFNLFCELNLEYTYRYGKVHKTARPDTSLIPFLVISPNNIPDGPFTQPTLAMPDIYKQDDAVQAYRAYYIGAKQKMAAWKNREIPEWWR